MASQAILSHISQTPERTISCFTLVDSSENSMVLGSEEQRSNQSAGTSASTPPAAVYVHSSRSRKREEGDPICTPTSKTQSPIARTHLERQLGLPVGTLKRWFPRQAAQLTAQYLEYCAERSKQKIAQQCHQTDLLEHPRLLSMRS